MSSLMMYPTALGVHCIIVTGHFHHDCILSQNKGIHGMNSWALMRPCLEHACLLVQPLDGWGPIIVKSTLSGFHGIEPL